MKTVKLYVIEEYPGDEDTIISIWREQNETLGYEKNQIVKEIKTDLNNEDYEDLKNGDLDIEDLIDSI